MSKKILAPSLLAILLLSTNTPSYAKINILWGATYSTGAAIFAPAGFVLGFLTYAWLKVGPKKLVKELAEKKFRALFFIGAKEVTAALVAGIVSSEVIAGLCIKEAYKNFSMVRQGSPREDGSLKKEAKKSRRT